MKRKVKIISLFLISMVLLTGCAGIQERLQKVVKEVETEQQEEKEVKKEPEYGGEAILPLANMGTLNPITNQNRTYFYFSQLIYEGLFEFDEKLGPKEKLAEGYSIEDDGKIINVTLRDDVYWHDGTKLTAEDVVFTLNVIKSSGRNSIYGDMIVNAFSPYSEVSLGTAINASGQDNKVTFNFPNGYSNNLEVLTFPIIPKHIFDSVNHALTHEDYPLVGTGPFKFESYTKLKELNLVVNEEYWDGKPYLEKIKGRIYGSEDDIERAFEIGQVNMIVAKEADWEKYGTTDRMRVLEYVSPNYEFLAFNFNKDIFMEEGGKNLRKAIAYGVNRDTIIDKVYLGHATKTDLPLNPYSWLYQDDKRGYQFDKKSANNYMIKADMGNKGDSGYLLDEKGNRLSLTLLTNTLNPRRYGAAEIIKQDLKEIGIEVIIEPEERINDLTDEEKRDAQWEAIEGRIRSGDFDMVLSGWEFSPIENMGYMFHSNNRGNGKNFIRYSNPDMDKAIEEQLFSGGTRALKKEKVEELSDIILEELPYMSLFYKNEGLLVDKSLHGDLKPVMLNPYRGMKNVYRHTK